MIFFTSTSTYELIKELASDEFIEKKIKDILGENDVDSGKEK